MEPQGSGRSTYIIAFMIGGEAEAYHNQIVKDISSRFSLQNVSEMVDPHITLKSAFETDNVAGLESVLARFCSQNKKSEMELRGFGHFDKDVIYMDVRPSGEAMKMFQGLTRELKGIEWMGWTRYDAENMKFHATLAAYDIREKFDGVWNYLNMTYSPEFVVFFDNITILRLENGKLVRHKEFAFKL